MTFFVNCIKIYYLKCDFTACNHYEIIIIAMYFSKCFTIYCTLYYNKFETNIIFFIVINFMQLYILLLIYFLFIITIRVKKLKQTL